jgi:pyridoxal phosphate enzyme (YggS family)
VGENYAQEAREKRPEIQATLEGTPAKLPRWHFIGKLQRNKARLVVPLFDVVQTLDRPALGAELERQAARAGRRLEVHLQVNLSAEAAKGGVAPQALPQLLAASAAWPHIDVRGLMAIPEARPDPEQVRPAFARLRELRDGLRQAQGGAKLWALSMGMSADFEVAIEEGATHVRVGTALFGPRARKDP